MPSDFYEFASHLSGDTKVNEMILKIRRDLFCQSYYAVSVSSSSSGTFASDVCQIHSDKMFKNLVKTSLSSILSIFQFTCICSFSYSTIFFWFLWFVDSNLMATCVKLKNRLKEKSKSRVQEFPFWAVRVHISVEKCVVSTFFVLAFDTWLKRQTKQRQKVLKFQLKCDDEGLSTATKFNSIQHIPMLLHYRVLFLK